MPAAGALLPTESKSAEPEGFCAFEIASGGTPPPLRRNYSNTVLTAQNCRILRINRLVLPVLSRQRESKAEEC